VNTIPPVPDLYWLSSNWIGPLIVSGTVDGSGRLLYSVYYAPTRLPCPRSIFRLCDPNSPFLSSGPLFCMGANFMVLRGINNCWTLLPTSRPYAVSVTSPPIRSLLVRLAPEVLDYPTSKARDWLMAPRFFKSDC